MIPQKIQSLFIFIDYLDQNKGSYIEHYIPLCNELINLDIEKSKLKPTENYNDKLKFDIIQAQINEKFAPLTENVYEPIVNKLLELEIWSGDTVFSSIWNNNISEIIDFKSNFSSDQVIEVQKYKNKYLSFREETNTNFLCLAFVIQNLDQIFKVLFDFFKDTSENEFDSFEAKTIEIDSIEDFVKHISTNKNKNVQFSIPTENLLRSPQQKYIPPSSINNINYINELIMGDQFKGIKNSKIYNRSTFTDAFNSIKTNYSDDTAKALEIVKSLVEQSGNQEAGELFDSFNEEVQKEKPKTSVLTSLWDGLTKIVPLITNTVGLVDKIMPLFQPHS